MPDFRSMSEREIAASPSLRVRDDWYVVCTSHSLRQKPLSVTLFDIPIVLFRGARGEAGALLDRCPHRNAPLSVGAVKGENLQCGYHGWEFDIQGECRKVPGLAHESMPAGFRTQRFAVREQQGFIWLYATPDVVTDREPFRFPLVAERSYTTVSKELEVEAGLHATAENALDVPHTAYLHGGLFRTAAGPRKQIEVVVSRYHDRVEAEYIGEQRPSGIAGRLLAPRQGTVWHVDRFILPCIAQIEYRLGDTTHLSITNALTPVSDDRTRLFTVVSFRVGLPAWMISPAIRPILQRIFHQDAFILKRQTETIRQFGGEHFHSTEIDVLGPHIYRLLKQAALGNRDTSEEPFVKNLRMTV